MPFWWPFGRKRRKSRRRSKLLAAEQTAKDEKKSTQAIPVSSATHSQSPIAAVQSRQPQSLHQGHTRNPSSSSQPPPVSTLRGTNENNSTEDITALPRDQVVDRSPHLRPIYEPGAQSPGSTTARRGGNNSSILKRKSSKKRGDLYLREQEIRSMTPAVSIPRRTDPYTQAFLKLEDTRDRRGLQTDSTVSLPMAPSVRSSITAMSDNRYEVGSVDLFSARPKIRYSLQSQAASGALIRSANQSRSDQRRDQDLSPRQLKESKTIDNLADTYDAGTLRELMERDKRRRERKQRAEEQRARRRLERHAAQSEGTPRSKSGDHSQARRKEAHRRDHKQHHDGLGLVDVDAEPAGKAQDQHLIGSQAGASVVPQLGASHDPFQDHTSDIVTPVDEPVVGTAKEVRYSMASLSPTPSPIIQAPRDSPSSQVHNDRPIEASSVADNGAHDYVSEVPMQLPRKTNTFTSVFRRGVPAKNKSLEDTPEPDRTQTSFSNTSRESMARHRPPAHLRERTSVSRAGSGTPTRTMSKFKEDLPELSRAAPDPELQSSGIIDASTLSARRREKLPEGSQAESRTVELHGSNRNSIGSNPPISAAQVSQSLASVDSEGSWLSGRPPKRMSGQLPYSTIALEGHQGHFASSYEDLGMPEEEYFRRMTLAPNTSRAPKTSGIKVALASSDQEMSRIASTESLEQIQHGHVDRTPTVVHRQTRIKSNEGLLRQWEGDEVRDDFVERSADPVNSSTDDDDSPSLLEEPFSRAGSLEAQHARRVSSGSARLLDIPSRRDSQRSSTLSPLPPRDQ